MLNNYIIYRFFNSEFHKESLKMFFYFETGFCLLYIAKKDLQRHLLLEKLREEFQSEENFLSFIALYTRVEKSKQLRIFSFNQSIL